MKSSGVQGRRMSNQASTSSNSCCAWAPLLSPPNFLLQEAYHYSHFPAYECAHERVMSRHSATSATRKASSALTQKSNSLNFSKSRPFSQSNSILSCKSEPTDRVYLLSPNKSKQSTIRLRAPNLRHQLYVFWVLFFFAGSSLGAIFINKTCLTGYHFRYPLTLVLGQMLFAVLFLSLLHILGYRTLPGARRQDLLCLAVPTVLFTSNVVVGLSALSLVNIPMFSAFRRLTLLFVMGAEYVFLNKTHSRAIMYTVVVMTFGAFISAVDDVTFSRLGYCLVFLNNVLTAGYLAAIKRAMKETSYDPLALLYYTALMGFPVVAVLLISTGELKHVIVAFRTQPELLSWRFLASLVLTATGAFAVNFSTSLCIHVTSPLTTSVAGQVKNVLQTILGFFSWGFVPTVMNTIGLLVALGAQIWFALLKYQERQLEESSDRERPISAQTVSESTWQDSNSKK